MNTGQLKTVLRDQYLVNAVPLNKVSGQPFTIAEIEAAIARHLGPATAPKSSATSCEPKELVAPANDTQLPSRGGSRNRHERR
jgi:2-oxoglutarate ferredoxin oxidoreductase subunit alpha